MRQISKVKTGSLLLASVCLMMFAGCANQTVEKEVEVSDYLNETALTAGKDRQLGSYIIEDVVVGTFIVEKKENAKFHIQDSIAAYADYEYGKMLFDKYVALTGDYIEAGEPIAKVHIEVSEADLTEARMAIQRMEERVEADRLLYEKEDAILKKKAYPADSKYVHGVEIWEYETSLERHRQDIEAQKKAIEKAKENLAKMEQADAITEITAPISGYIKDVETFVYGDVIPNEMILAILEPQKSGILVVNNEENAFRYGKDVIVRCIKDDLEKEFTGVVISPSRSSVASQASDRMARIRIDEEGAAFLSETKVNTIEVKVRTVEQENAIMVKMGSLELDSSDKDSSTAYATVVREDGSFLKKKVMIGGMSESAYWVIEGLEETDSIVVP